MVKTLKASPIISAFKGALAALSLSLILLLTLGKILTESEDIDLLTAIIPKAVQLVSAFVGGILAGKFSTEKKLLSGIVSGCIFAVIISVISLIIGEFGFLYFIIQTASLTLTSGLGSLILSSERKNESSRRKNMLKKLRR